MEKEVIWQLSFNNIENMNFCQTRAAYSSFVLLATIYISMFSSMLLNQVFKIEIFQINQK